MTRRRSRRGGPSLLGILVLATLGAPAGARAQEGQRNDEYRLTLFPSAPIAKSVTGFGYLGYVNSPDKHYTSYYVGWPGVAWTVKPRVFQIWSGLIGLYTNNQTSADKFELRPFLGFKVFVPNDAKVNLYTFTRYEYRATKDLDTHDWSSVNRIRSRFGAEIPLTSRARTWQPKTFYAIADFEAFYRFDHDTFDPVRLRAGLGYIFKGHVHAEFIYHMQFTHLTTDDPLEFTDNIFRLNIKISLKKGIVSRFMDGSLDE